MNIAVDCQWIPGRMSRSPGQRPAFCPPEQRPLLCGRRPPLRSAQARSNRQIAASMTKLRRPDACSTLHQLSALAFGLHRFLLLPAMAASYGYQTSTPKAMNSMSEWVRERESKRRKKKKKSMIERRVGDLHKTRDYIGLNHVFLIHSSFPVNETKIIIKKLVLYK